MLAKSRGNPYKPRVLSISEPAIVRYYLPAAGCKCGGNVGVNMVSPALRSLSIGLGVQASRSQFYTDDDLADSFNWRHPKPTVSCR